MALKKILMVAVVAAVLVACGGSRNSETRSEGDSSCVTPQSSSSETSLSSSSVPEGYVDPSTVVKGTMTDERDGKIYKTVKIGTQTWMAENLNYAYTGVPYSYKEKNKDTVYTSDSTSWCYKNDSLNCAKYGRLYSWAAAMDSVGTWSTNGKGCGYNKTCSPTYPVRGICPEGWHLPDSTEWNMLFTAVGGKSIAGKKLKSTSGWNDYEKNIYNGTDAYAFSALPAGNRYDYGVFNDESYYAYFWSSTEHYSECVYLMYLFFYNDNVNSDHIISKNRGLSVRCIKDDGQSSVTPQSSSSETSVSSSSSSLSSSWSGAIGSSSSFPEGYVDPLTIIMGELTDERDGQAYKTVKIGTQTWMAENLNYVYIGVPYKVTYKDNSYTSDSTSWCYKNDSTNCVKYGRLYTWAAAMDSVGEWSTNGKGCGWEAECSPTYPVRGICPEGWHLPSQAEWNILFTAVGGQSTAGKMLKFTSGWKDNKGESGNGTDAYSFSALPAGSVAFGGGYLSEGYFTYFWSSTEYNSLNAYNMNLFRSSANAFLNYYYKYYGYSVRCVKD